MPIFGKRVPYEPKHLKNIDEELDTDISHHGIKGMKWGIRRYQDENSHSQKLLPLYWKKY